MSIITPEPEQPVPAMSKFALPSVPTEMVVTYDMAGDWLDYRFNPGKNTHKQRKSHAKVKVDQMSKLMAKGKFPVTHQAMAFDINGWLQDGWHRLSALRLAGQTDPSATFTAWVFPNQDPGNFDSIDVGTPRRAAQLYSGAHGGLITSAVRYLYPDSFGHYKRDTTVSEQLRMAERWHELPAWAPSVNIIARRTHIPGAQHLAVLAQAARSDHSHMIEEWIKGTTEGWELPNGDPRGHLRNRRWREEQMSPDDIYGIIAKAWILHTQGNRVQLLRFAANEATPEIPGFWGPPEM